MGPFNSRRKITQLNVFTLNVFTFNLNDAMFSGIENNLYDPEELFDLPSEYRCSYVGARMDRSLIGNVDEYQQYAEIPHEPFIASGKCL